MATITTNHINNMYKAYSFCTFILTVKYFLAIVRNLSPNRVKEDYKEGKEPTPNKELTEDQMRRTRIAGNGIENEPLDLAFFFLALLFTSFNYISNQGDSEAIALTILICVYTFARTFYWVCYAKGWQPWRSIMFLIGKICAFSAAVILIITAFKVDFNSFFK